MNYQGKGFHSAIIETGTLFTVSKSIFVFFSSFFHFQFIREGDPRPVWSKPKLSPYLQQRITYLRCVLGLFFRPFLEESLVNIPTRKIQVLQIPEDAVQIAGECCLVEWVWYQLDYKIVVMAINRPAGLTNAPTAIRNR